MPDTLYKRLGGYDAIAAVCDDLLPRLMGDAQLARFWQNRAQDSIRREKQLLVDFLCSCSGGPLYYVGRDMKTSHRGMGISESDWQRFIGGQARRGSGHHRSQRGRQKHASQNPQSHHRADHRADPAARTGRQPIGGRNRFSPRAHGARKHLPERRDLGDDPPRDH